MRDYLIKRILLAIGVIFAISAITFFVLNIVPGDPVRVMVGDMADEVLSLAPVREMDSWLTDLEGGRPHAVRAEQAAAVVRVIETMYESARQGRTVRLD